MLTHLLYQDQAPVIRLNSTIQIRIHLITRQSFFIKDPRLRSKLKAETFISHKPRQPLKFLLKGDPRFLSKDNEAIHLKAIIINSWG